MSKNFIDLFSGTGAFSYVLEKMDLIVFLLMIMLNHQKIFMMQIIKNVLLL